MKPSFRLTTAILLSVSRIEQLIGRIEGDPRWGLAGFAPISAKSLLKAHRNMM